MKRRLALVVLLVLAVPVAFALWLGPGALSWSARAWAFPADEERTWRHVPAEAPGVATCRLARLLDSPIGVELRPELSALAAMQGADLAWFEDRIEEVVVVHDGEATGYALGRRFSMSPLLIARFDERWGPIEGAGRLGASDGLLALFPLEPGLVLATEAEAAGRALQMAGAAEPGRAALQLEEPGFAIHALLRLTPALRARLRRELDPRAQPVVEALSSAELRLSALDELSAELELGCRDEAAAARVEQLLRQLDLASRTARGAGLLARALLGEAGVMLAELPELEVAREGAIVRVGAEAGAEELRPWLRRAMDALAGP